eukprot:CAMPEP_0174749226 /NCGR_PEP_ID=MMETSP1094-20130205/95206_1 /TAXON_ID=156173 /ORGANISM="Chrysochromulina brevifilum, Strain UTEX LB 985" /LENGTH=108 /DNA_ID=CAMNT_0015954399 /DNA_START=99 /DNA_END=426 /DNA_ORIENTATION=-
MRQDQEEKREGGGRRLHIRGEDHREHEEHEGACSKRSVAGPELDNEKDIACEVGCAECSAQDEGERHRFDVDAAREARGGLHCGRPSQGSANVEAQPACNDGVGCHDD